jgi:3',5'-cyclic AMP phosphodiesterase CpdA
MNRITWLHLSDFHFRAGAQHVWNENIVLDALLDDVRSRMAGDGLRPDFVVVSGDLAFSGQPAEYDLAGKFFDELLQATGLGKERLFLVPGNHDVDRRAISRGAQAVTDALDARDAANAILSTPGDRQLVLARFQGYAAFVNGYLAGHLPFNDEGYYYVKTLDLAGQRLALLGLNSAWVAASDQDKAQGLLLGERQTRTALREADGADATLKLALLHHPLDWLREFDQNDSGALLLDRCDFLLHGHLHQTATAQLTSPDGAATILACGACYKTRESPNMYNWVRLDLAAGTGTVYLRRYSDARGGFWAPDTLTYRNVTNGEYTFALRGQLALPPAESPAITVHAPSPPAQHEHAFQNLVAGLHIDPDDPPYAALRDLLLEAFSPDALRRFCQERSHFRTVLSNIGSGASPNEIVDALFELCRTRLMWDQLLAEVAQARPEQVARYVGRLLPEPMSAQEIQNRHKEDVVRGRPTVARAIRLIPKAVFRTKGLLGKPERKYVVVGDYAEQRYRSLEQILGNLWVGERFEEIEQENAEWVVIVFEVGTLNRTKLDLMAGTWKAVFWILADRKRLGLFPITEKEETRMGDGQQRNYYDGEQRWWYDRITAGGRGFEAPQTEALLERILGISDLCYRGEGMSSGVVPSRLFLVKNLALRDLSYTRHELGRPEDQILLP